MRIAIIELSMSGLMIEAPASKKLTIGMRVRLEFHGTDAIVEVHNMRPHEHPDRQGDQIIGVSFFTMSDEFDALIADIVHKLQLASKH